MPLADVSQAYAQLEAQPGTSFAATVGDRRRRSSSSCSSSPRSTKVSSEIGFEPGGTYFTGYSMGAVNAAFMMITLSDSSKRKRDIWQVIDGVRDEALRTIPGIRRLAIKEMGADVMASSAAPIQVIIFGPDLDKLAEMGEQARALAEEIPGFVPGLHLLGHDAPAAPRRSWTAPGRRSWASRWRRWRTRPTTRSRAASPTSSTALDNKRQFTILLRYRGDQRRDRRDLEQVKIVGKKGEVVPARARWPGSRSGRGPTLIEHDNFRRVDLGARLLPQGRAAEHGALDGPADGGPREARLPAGLRRRAARAT